MRVDLLSQPAHVGAVNASSHSTEIAVPPTLVPPHEIAAHPTPSPRLPFFFPPLQGGHHHKYYWNAHFSVLNKHDIYLLAHTGIP